LLGARFGEQRRPAPDRGRNQDRAEAALEPPPVGLLRLRYRVGPTERVAARFDPLERERPTRLVFGAFVFPPLLLAAIFSFLNRETLGASALGLISFSWLSTALVFYVSPPPATSAVLGVLSLIMAVILLLLGVAAVLGKPILAVLIVIASARYGLNGLYDLTEIAALQTTSGWIGLAIFAATLYGGLAFGLEDVQHKTVLPLGRRGEALRAFEGDFSEQVGTVKQEAGVRKQL
jgi:uncharacterized protein